MATFLLAPAALDVLGKGKSQGEAPLLEVSDDQYDYGIEEGSGLWIPVFIDFIERKVRKLGRDGRFSFSSQERIGASLLEEIPSSYVRGLIIRFCNEQYEPWRDRDVDLPDYEEIRADCRSYCDDCDSGWEVQYGTYDGPQPEEVEPDEDADETGIGEEERRARILRNRARHGERQRREEARDEAEGEEVGREFICDDECDGFCDCVYEAYRDEFSVGDGELEARWQAFLRTGRRGRFPPLQPS
jgi:hypothetical protein